MKAIFVCENSNNIFNAFDRNTICKLSKLTGIEEVVYKKSEIINDPERFSDVEMLFSSWDIPIFSSEEIKKCFPRLKSVFYAAGSVRHFARPYLETGIKVFSAWAANAVPVAEMTVAQIILANKGYYLSSRTYRNEGYSRARAVFGKCRGNYGETVGIIGAGMIGKLVIEMLKAYNLNVIVFDPFLSDEKAEELGVKKCTLDEVFENAFVVSNHLANNDRTKGMLTYALFSKMRENAVFINTGRGAQVVEEDLTRILTERDDLTALLDVTAPEPPIENHPFYTLPNCILTPHIAGSAGDEVGRMGEFMLEECKSFLEGKACKYEVNLKMLETMA
jgi:phosphoglycerate dehydrogenase-like enzyme